MHNKYSYIIVFVFLARVFSAQDIKGAYIQTNWIPSTNTIAPVYQYSFTVVLLTDAKLNVPRPAVTVTFSFGQTETFSLTSSHIDGKGNVVKKYSGSHTFPGSNPDGTYYYARFLDTFRIQGIRNMTNSNTQPICAEARLAANPFVGSKNSGTITNFPPTIDVLGNQVIYDPLFVGSNDSVSYTLLNYCSPSGYYIPNGVILSPTSGILSFSKDSLGLYSFNLKINEWHSDVTTLKKIIRTTYVDFLIDINSTVGFEEKGYNGNSINVFPNPTEKGVQLKFSSYEKGSIQVQIKDLLGKEIFTKSISVSQFSEYITLEEFQNGIYFLSITKDKELIYKVKIIKQN